MNESCHTHDWVMSHVWMRHVTHMNESCHTHEWVLSHVWMSHVTHLNKSCHTYESGMSHIRMSHITHLNESCHTYEWVMNLDTHINESFHINEQVSSHIGQPLIISHLNGHRSLLGFEAKVMSTDKIWKQEFYMNTLFKFVRVLQVKDRLNARALFDLMDSSWFQSEWSYLDVISF